MSLLMIGCRKMCGSLLTRSAGSTDHTNTIVNPTKVNAASYVIVTHAMPVLPEQRFDIIVVTGKSQLNTQVLLGNRPHLTNLVGMMVIVVIFSVSSIEKLMAKQANMRIMRPTQIAQGISVFSTKPCYNPSPINSAMP